MRNILTFLWKYRLTLLFVFLEFIALSLVVANNSYHNTKFSTVSNSVSGEFYETVSNATDYLKLQEVNDSLSLEIAKLKGEDRASFTKLKGHLGYIKDTLYLQQYQYLSARVINSTVNRRNNYITINQGSEQGVKPDMGVVGPAGIVGIVKNVSEHYATVISVLHEHTKITAKFQKNNYFGELIWEGSSPRLATLRDVPKHVDVQVGDTVVTRGSSTIFPTDVYVGTIETIEEADESDFHVLQVQLSTDFNNLAYVYVVRNLMKDEQLLIEEELNDD